MAAQAANGLHLQADGQRLSVPMPKVDRHVDIRLGKDLGGLKTVPQVQEALGRCRGGLSGR